MKRTQFLSMFVAAFALVTSTAFAAQKDGAPQPACEGLKIATGPAGKGYSKLFKNIQAVCGKEVAVCEVNTTGGLDNLNAMSTKKADIGIAQLDTWSTMKAGDENVAGLQGVVGLNFNYLHPVTAVAGYSVKGDKKYFGMKDGEITNVTIQRFSDLRGKKVALVGSAQLLGRQLDRQHGYGMILIDVQDDDAAFKMVQSGQVAAALTVSGWPHGLLDEKKQDSGLTLVPFDAPAGNGQVVRSINYKGLGVYNSNALAMPNLLLTRPFQGEKATQVAALKACLTNNLLALKEGSYEPAWNEIKDLNNTFDVPRFSAPAPAAVAAPVTAPAKAAKK